MQVKSVEAHTSSRWWGVEVWRGVPALLLWNEPGSKLSVAKSRQSIRLCNDITVRLTTRNPIHQGWMDSFLQQHLV
ncbi:hypothetical protein TNCV_3449311 [Trichonephila clavipes]|nr:hypothetical protein TNCV_3449311 [Trichonephila clavipes]